MLQALPYIKNNSIKHNIFVYTQLNDQIVLFLTIQLSMSFICPQCKCQTVLIYSKIGLYQVFALRVRVFPETNGNERVFYILQSSKTGATPSDCLMFFHDTRCRDLTSLQKCSQCFLSLEPTVLKKNISVRFGFIDLY